jgi:tRNA dimethylallyltransferase
MNAVVAVVGPTAVGKSRVAALLARTFNGEIISADSRQVYRYMDIGTAKPTAEERSAVPHHLIDVVDPDADFSVAVYQSLAADAIGRVLQAGRLPILVGGSGLYVWSMVEGWEIPRIEPDPGLRQRLEAQAAAEGGKSLYRELQRVDQEAAASIDPRNVRRVIRALEIRYTTGRPGSERRLKKPPPFQTVILGLTAERQRLYRMIDQRVDRMMEEGLVQEVRALVKKGYGPGLPAMSSVGYKEIYQFVGGKIGLATAVHRMKFETHRFARHQYAWFRLNDPRIHWFDIDREPDAGALAAVREAVG